MSLRQVLTYFESSQQVMTQSRSQPSEMFRMVKSKTFTNRLHGVNVGETAVTL